MVYSFRPFLSLAQAVKLALRVIKVPYELRALPYFTLRYRPGESQAKLLPVDSTSLVPFATGSRRGFAYLQIY